MGLEPATFCYFCCYRFTSDVHCILAHVINTVTFYCITHTCPDINKDIYVDRLVYSRGVDRRAVHQRGVVVVFHKVALLGLLGALLGFVRDGDIGAVRRVVEVDDVHVEHQHG